MSESVMIFHYAQILINPSFNFLGFFKVIFGICEYDWLHMFVMSVNKLENICNV
jgi:hypothetical protein